MIIKLTKYILLFVIHFSISCFLAFIILFALRLPYGDIVLMFSDSNYFWFDGKRIAILFTVPFLMYACINVFLMAIFGKNKIVDAMGKFGSFFSFFTVFFFLFALMLTLLFYLYIVFFSDYRSCKQVEIQHYFVNKNSICFQLNKSSYY